MFSLGQFISKPHKIILPVITILFLIYFNACTSDEISSPAGGIVTYSQIDFDAAWSKSGDRIAYSHNDLEPEFSGLYVMDSSGANVTQLEEGNISNPDWSPLDTALLYDVGGSVFSRDMISGNKRIISLQANARVAKWNPVQPVIAYISGNNLLMTNPDGTEQSFIDSGCDWPAWSPDGNILYYFKPSYDAGGNRNGDSLKSFDLRDSTIRLVGDITSGSYLSNSHLSVSETEAFFSSTFGDGSSYVYQLSFLPQGLSQIISQFSYSPNLEAASGKLIYTNRTPSDGRLWIREENGSLRKINY